MRKLRLWEIKGPAWGHASGNGWANLNLLMKSRRSFWCSLEDDNSPTILPDSKMGKKKDGSRSFTDFTSIPWRSRTDWCKCGSVWVSVLGDRTCWEGKTDNFCFDCYTHPAGKKRRKIFLAGVERTLPENGMDALTCQRHPPVQLTPWYCTRETLNT